MTEAPATPEQAAQLGVRYIAHPLQLAFHSLPQANRWYCGGYGVGKTTAGVFEAFSAAVVSHPGYVGIVAAPTYPLLMQAWFTEWRQWIPQEWWRLRQHPKQGDYLEVLNPAGPPSTILLRSTNNPWSNEGVNAAWLVFDEAPRERNASAYHVLVGRLRRGYPGRQRLTVLTGPPQSRQHWTAQEFGSSPEASPTAPDRAALDSAPGWGTRDHALVQARTRDNPYLPPDYEARLRARPGATKAWCAQYLDARFGAMEGQVYPMFDPRVHVPTALEWGLRAPTGRGVVQTLAGVDWGWSHAGVMLVGLLDATGNLWVAHEEIHREKVISEGPEGWLTLGRHLTEQWGIERWFCDPAQPQAIAQLQRTVNRTRRRSLVYDADNDVAEGIRLVAARLEAAVDLAASQAAAVAAAGARGQLVGAPPRPALYIHPRCVGLIASLEAYSRKRALDGAITDAPEKKHDDPADALRYLVAGALTG